MIFVMLAMIVADFDSLLLFFGIVQVLAIERLSCHYVQLPQAPVLSVVVHFEHYFVLRRIMSGSECRS